MHLTRFTDLGLRILMRLAVLGVVETRRGRYGGLAITELGRTVSVGWVTRRLEGPDEVIECEGDNPCPLRNTCRLRSVLRDAQEAFFGELDKFTVDDLTSARTGQVLLTLGTGPTD